MSGKKSGFDYCYCYCEENIYRLSKALCTSKASSKDKLYVIFISNANKTIPIFKPEGDYVVWDYHVILIEKDQEHKRSTVYDFDIGNSLQTNFKHYVKFCLRPNQISNLPQYKHTYRIVPVQTMWDHFSSDRSHMKDEKGKWLQPPPSWPCITIENVSTNLFSDFVNMTNTRIGEIGDSSKLISFFEFDNQ